jgi:hypothetical protein
VAVVASVLAALFVLCQIVNWQRPCRWRLRGRVSAKAHHAPFVVGGRGVLVIHVR